jgi:large subunit ribosomal protein L5
MTKALRQSRERKHVSNFLEKIVINAGVGRASQQPNFEEKVLTQITRDIASLSGQKPQVCRSRKSIASFKVREGQIIGVKVTLRRAKMVDFFERLITIVLPRVRDFAGIAVSNIDKNGVLNIGFREQFVFPEIHPEESLFTFSLGLNIIPKKRNREESLALYRELGVPLKK